VLARRLAERDQHRARAEELAARAEVEHARAEARAPCPRPKLFFVLCSLCATERCTMSSGRLGVLGVRGGSAPSPPESHLSLRPPRRAAGRARAGRGAALARGGGGSGGARAEGGQRRAAPGAGRGARAGACGRPPCGPAGAGAARRPSGVARRPLAVPPCGTSLLSEARCRIAKRLWIAADRIAKRLWIATDRIAKRLWIATDRIAHDL